MKERRMSKGAMRRVISKYLKFEILNLNSLTPV